MKEVEKMCRFKAYKCGCCIELTDEGVPDSLLICPDHRAKIDWENLPLPEIEAILDKEKRKSPMNLR